MCIHIYVYVRHIYVTDYMNTSCPVRIFPLYYKSLQGSYS